MASRRNTLTAVFFLAGLLAAAVFLLTGSFGQTSAASIPARRPASTPDWSVTKLPEPVEELPMAHEVNFRDLLRGLVTWEELLPPPELPVKGTSLYTGWSKLERVSKLAPVAMEIPVETTLATSLEAMVEEIDRTIRDTGPDLIRLLDRKHTFIELYGGLQRLMGRRVTEDADPQYTVVKLDDGSLAFANPDDRQPADMTQRADELLLFARRVSLHFDAPLLYVQAPSKSDVSALPEGLSSPADAEADQFLALLEEGGVDTLDLREVFRDIAETSPNKAGELFFTTDHHWTPAGAFVAYQEICRRLEEDYDFKLDSSVTDPNSFTQVTLDGMFLGSQGRRVGSLYAGLDDFQLWLPTFPTSFAYSVPLNGIYRWGSFADSLLFLDQLDHKDLYASNPYTLYAGGDYLLAWATNHYNGDGRRILVLRDSFGCAVTPFLSLAASQVMALDPRCFEGDQEAMINYMNWLSPDLVIVLNTASSLRAPALFPYLPSAYEAAQAGKD